MDRIYTPRAVADALVAAAAISPSSVADFAAGDGALLVAAQSRWPSARLTALDVDEQAVARLRARFPLALCIEADFLEADATLRDRAADADLILLNPPFSCRGNKRFDAEVAGRAVRCSLAMAFVCRALSYLAPHGELICILPASCLSSAKDAEVRKAIGAAYAVEILEARARSVFEGHSVVVTQVRIANRPLADNAWRALAPLADVKRLRGGFKVLLGRGATPVHKASVTQGEGVFIHTTDIAQGEIGDLSRRVARRPDLDAAPTLLLPRVGRPASGKVVVTQGRPLILSDCLIWLRTQPSGLETELKDLILSRWPEFSGLYGGSCAPYTTLAAVAGFLENCGLETELAGRSLAPQAASTRSEARRRRA